MGIARLTLAGAERLAQASIDPNAKPVPKTAKISSADVELEPTLTSLPSVWAEVPIAGARKVNENTIEFIVDVPPERAKNHLGTVALCFDDGTIFALAKPDYRLPPNTRQRLVVRVVYNSIPELLDLRYVPLDDFEFQLIDWASFFVGTEGWRQFLSSGVLSTDYGEKSPEVPVEESDISHLSWWSALGIHNHSNYRNMPGLGQFAVQVNGFVFQTRHNDYRIFTKDAEGGLYELGAPKAPSLSIPEMQDLFRRFLGGTLSAEEKALFRWDLAYLEVFIAELDSPFDLMEDTFPSFRHTWGSEPAIVQLQRAFESRLTGKKPRFENVPLLPVFSLPNGKYGVLLYRVLVEPLRFLDGLPPSEVIEPYELYELEHLPITSPKKRFRLKVSIDQVVESVPGLDGRGAFLEELETVDGYKITGKNFAYYHRTYQIERDAVNTTFHQNGWNDRTLFVAHTQNPKVFGGVSFMLPLELILRTPLETWNPYGVPYKATVAGAGTQDNPYDGWNPNGKYFLTPAEFFESLPPATVADTQKSAYVKTAQGTKLMLASGIWIVLPSISGIGQLRTRYPIYYDAFEEGLLGYFLGRVRADLASQSIYSYLALSKELSELREEINRLKGGKVLW